MATSEPDVDKLCGDFATKNAITSVSESKIEAKTDVNDNTKDIEKLCDNSSNISEEIRKKLSENYIKCVKGYHLINDDPIKETPWEDINAQVLSTSGCNIEAQSNGSHKPGADLLCSLGALSNKSTQYESNNKSFKLSSYRLTTVCSDKTPGNIESIIAEINSRKNFKYYSIIVRDEKEKEFQYDWYLIPSDYPQFNPSSYKWIPKIGKQGKNKGSTTGWETNIINGSSMSITFSMSSQLWIDIVITEEIKKFVISSCKVNKGRKLNYIKLYEREMGI
jgi:hypothetical protein